MSKMKYYDIYLDLKAKIETDVYKFQQILPSENTLRIDYACSRNTIRRALSDLASEGYLQSKHGKGVTVIYHPETQGELKLTNGTRVSEQVAKENKSYHTQIIEFKEVHIDEQLSQITMLPVGAAAYYVERVRFIDDEPLIIHKSYFLQEDVPNLTKEIAEVSVYRYMEEQLQQTIGTTRRRITVERVTTQDQTYLLLGDFNCVGVVQSYTHNSNGKLFEFSQTRHVPERFVFADQVQRVQNTVTHE